MFLISTIITLPIIGAIFTACCDKEKIENSFNLNKIIVLINSLVSFKLFFDYINYGNYTSFQESFFLLSFLGVFNLGIDALSLLLILTLNLLFAFVLFLNKKNINHEDSRTNQAWYMVLYGFSWVAGNSDDPLDTEILKWIGNIFGPLGPILFGTIWDTSKTQTSSIRRGYPRRIEI